MDVKNKKKFVFAVKIYISNKNKKIGVIINIV